jgi:hypothetical protein
MSGRDQAHLRRTWARSSGPALEAQDYRDLLCLLFELIRIARRTRSRSRSISRRRANSADLRALSPILADHEAVD